MNCNGLGVLLLLAAVVMPVTDLKADSSKEPALVINEIMPANLDMFLDPSFNYGSWIELYNPDTVDIDIRGWFLSNDAANTRQCPLGDRSRVIKAKGFLTLWFGHIDDYCPDQIDFSLENDYDNHSLTSFVMLSDSDGVARIAQYYPFIPARISWARQTDGGDQWGLTGFPTPSATNITSKFASEQLPAPQIDVDSKLFTEDFNIYIDIPEGASLYYTNNSSLPVPGNPSVKISSGFHTVNATNIYRFRLYKDGMLPSPVVTRSYIKTDNMYGIPVVSVVTANDNLYSTAYGIWAKGPNGKAGNGQTDLCNWNREWERPASIDFIDTDNKMIINQEVEISNAGRYSRAFEPHSIKLEAKKKYGYDNFFAFTPFSDKPYNKYKSLKIRNGGNSYQARFRDAAMHEVFQRSGVNLDCQSYQPVHHYINGVYKGVLNLREPNNRDYAYANYGIGDDNMDMFKVDHNYGDTGHGYGYAQITGTGDAWDELLELAWNAADEDSYNRICQLLDIGEFANYMAAEFILYNSDWPRNNVKAFRRRPDGRFRFILFDIDNILGYGADSSISDPFAAFDAEEYRSVIVTLFHNLLANDTFNKLFVDSYCILIGSVFQPDHFSPIINELGARAKREMSFNNESPQSDINMLLERINESLLSTRIYQLKSWGYTNTMSSMVTKNLSANLPQATLEINGIPVPTGKFKGVLLTKSTVTAYAPQGYTFTGWKKSNGTIVSTDPEYNLRTISNETLIACFTPDSIIMPVRINEVSAGNKVFINDSFKKHDWVELYNVTDQPYDVGGMYLSNTINKTHKYRIPYGTVIPAHGYLVIWCDNDKGPQLHAGFKLDKNENGNCVVLTANDDSWRDCFYYNFHEEFQSVGLYPDGATGPHVFNLPTIGKKNQYMTADTLFQKTVITDIRPDDYSAKQDRIFNLFGQPVSDLQPGGVYIRNRRKFVYLP